MDNLKQEYASHDVDTLETMTAAESDDEQGDSPTSEADAGLVNLDLDLPESPDEEIAITDLRDNGPSRVHSSELSDLNVPGEVDIEDLDEDALSDTDLPADARLDPLEP